MFITWSNTYFPTNYDIWYLDSSLTTISSGMTFLYNNILENNQYVIINSQYLENIALLFSLYTIEFISTYLLNMLVLDAVFVNKIVLDLAYIFFGQYDLLALEYMYLGKTNCLAAYEYSLYTFSKTVITTNNILYNANTLNLQYGVLGILFFMGVIILMFLKILVWYLYPLYMELRSSLINSHLSKTLRFPPDTIVFFFVLFVYYFISLLLYNETNDDIIGNWSSYLVTIYFILFLYYLVKYNINFFSFLELSITTDVRYKYITKQFMRDLSNFIAHILRLGLLFLRLNIYDGLDDVFDSYYIFVGDFNIYEFTDIFLTYFQTSNFLTDNAFDNSNLLYEEAELPQNIYYLYYLFFYKIFLFLFFIIEGILRITLALYIIVLLSLEINSFNVIYYELK